MLWTSNSSKQHRALEVGLFAGIGLSTVTGSRLSVIFNETCLNPISLLTNKAKSARLECSVEICINRAEYRVL